MYVKNGVTKTSNFLLCSKFPKSKMKPATFKTVFTGTFNVIAYWQQFLQINCHGHHKCLNIHTIHICMEWQTITHVTIYSKVSFFNIS